MGKPKAYPSLTKGQLTKMHLEGKITDTTYYYMPLEGQAHGIERIAVVKILNEPQGKWAFGYYQYGRTKDYFLAMIRVYKKQLGESFIFLDGSHLRMDDFIPEGGEINVPHKQAAKG